MPFKTFSNWLFDNNPKSPIPKILLNYNSPITNIYVIKLFMKHSQLNSYLNRYFNNIGLLYLDKEDLFLFAKQCVRDFNIKRKDIPYFPYRRKDKLFEILRYRNPCLKDYDIQHFCNIIDKLDQKDSIYASLGIEKKIEKKKIKAKKTKTLSYKSFLAKNFTIAEV